VFLFGAENFVLTVERNEFRVRIIDLGAAVALESAKQLVSARHGTHPYHSPEQHIALAPAPFLAPAIAGKDPMDQADSKAAVERPLVGLKSDVFSLGLVCLEVLTGVDPWRGILGNEQECLHQIRQHIGERRKSNGAVEPTSYVNPTLGWGDVHTEDLALPQVVIACLRQTFQIAPSARPTACEVADLFSLLLSSTYPPDDGLSYFPFFE